MHLNPKISWLGAILVAPFAIAAGVSTTPVDLGTLGGSISAANAINQSELFIVGNSNLTGDANAHAFKWSAANGLVDLGTLPLDPSTPVGNSSAAAISLIGHTVGTSDFDSTDSMGNINRYQHPFYYSGTGMVDLGTLAGTDANAYATAVKDFVVAGSSETAGEAATHAFTYKVSSNTMTDLGTLQGGLNSYAFGINLNGIVAGASDSSDGTTHAVIWKGTKIQDLGSLGGSYTQATAINSSDMAVGYGFIAGDNQAHAWVGNLQDIETLGGSFAQALAVNDYGTVVGSSNLKGDTEVHAFIWTKSTGMFDLNKLLPAGSGWTLISANGIAPNGTIVGVGTINGESHAFSWSLNGE